VASYHSHDENVGSFRVNASTIFFADVDKARTLALAEARRLGMGRCPEHRGEVLQAALKGPLAKPANLEWDKLGNSVLFDGYFASMNPKAPSVSPLAASLLAGATLLQKELAAAAPALYAELGEAAARSEYTFAIISGEEQDTLAKAGLTGESHDITPAFLDAMTRSGVVLGIKGYTGTLNLKCGSARVIVLKKGGVVFIVTMMHGSNVLYNRIGGDGEQRFKEMRDRKSVV
jgi:hypothetical protein